MSSYAHLGELCRKCSGILDCPLGEVVVVRSNHYVAAGASGNMHPPVLSIAVLWVAREAVVVGCFPTNTDLNVVYRAESPIGLAWWWLLSLGPFGACRDGNFMEREQKAQEPTKHEVSRPNLH